MDYLLDYYNDRKFCTHCNAYVPYLMSVHHSYCAECGREVRLFSEADWTAFNQSIKPPPKPCGRPRKGQEREEIADLGIA